MPNSRLVYIALGSNVGDRAAMLARAVEEMNRAGLRVLRQSSLYETEPVGGPPQPWFLNAVVEAETELPPQRVLQTLQQIEQTMGRQRSIACGPRTLDLDILLDGNSVIRSGELEIPHPRLAQRRFVLAPLAELAPALVHPLLRKTVAELLAEISDGGQVRLWNPESESAGRGG
jgi:2-amino-4-hydroxy-6-hydroxymethyldihydropteridine diphosphokinase